ncbi:UNVERIFIED_CONTAM: hypothetical protein Sradi_1945000 [Sesamum radiatum]|uniref:BP28 C-terminal domain-containing protein n=1 Tax=Sesamum radiatum TaxID=300843 RepID=A0AAW2TFH3_SESRA
MAGTSISSQLKAIKDVLNVSADPEPGRRRPLTRPSVLFDAKTAADIDLDTILNIALSGLEVLISMEERFRNYKNDLFSYQSKELDRELVGQEENNRINASISSYLRLLSGYLELHSSLKTLEYLIRRYKVHVYNAEDLILCALPYHDTHVFVQIVQLINTGNNRWKFLDGVKTSGARPPREVIVQQCIRDLGVLEAICNYATPVKKIQPSKHVIGFCTAVIFEVLGLVTIDNNIVKRILPYVNSGLQPGARGLNQKAGALMIVSLLAQKAALGPNVVKSLLHSVADITRVEAKERGDLQWLRMSFMTVITIVQLQSVEIIPKKTMDVLSDIRDISGILSGLTKDFNIDKFLAVFLDSLLEYSASDDLCHQTLLSIIETVPVKVYVNRVVSRLLSMSMKISQGKVNSVSSLSGNHGKQILVSICEKYPNESRGAFYSFLKNVRAAAMSCIEELFALWSRMSRNGSNRTWLHFLGQLLCLIIQQKKILLSDRDVLASFFSSLLGSSSDSLLVQDGIGKRFDVSTKDDILIFMVGHALGISSHAKLKILSLIKGVGSKLMSISGVRSLLNDLLESRRQYYLADGKSCHRLSQNEVDILCLLLESCTRPASSHEVHDCGELILKALQVRLLLPPVLSMYSDAIKSGESSLSIVFEMLGNLVGTMDRSSIGVYHAKVFDLCLLALDLRHQNPDSIQNIDVVEQNVINAVVTLTMKLTETMFRPLFIKTIEWSGLNVEGDENTPVKANSRAMSFYSLVNKLAESHRSLFVPYFKYLLDGCVRGLVGAEDTKPGLTQKKKKAKLSYNAKDGDDALSLQAWHLRALILSSLHKCFLYDTGSAKFLDSSNFQARAIFCFLKRYT